MALNAKTLPDDEFFFGHKACAGCGGSLAVRAALKVLGPNAVAALPAGCMSAVGFNFPQLSFANNAMITPFAATASVPQTLILATAQAAAPITPAAGNVTSQAMSIRAATFQSIVPPFLPRPEPMMEPEQTCVVERAKPKWEETKMVVAELASAAKP